MRKYKFLLFFGLSAALALPFSAFAQDTTPESVMGQDMMQTCPTPANLSGDVNIGAVFALSGGASVYGLSQQQAVNLAVEQINAAGYLGDGATLNVQFEDSAGDGQQAINAMTKLIEEDQVVAVLGPTLSSEANAAVPVAQDDGVPVLAVSNTQTGLRAALGDGFYHRVSLPESAAIPGTVEQAVQALGIQSVGILYGNDDDFTLSAYDVFVQALEDNGVSVVGTETFAKGDVDFNAQLTNLLSQNPDALVVSALAAEAIQIINQARAQGFTGTIIGGNGFNSQAVITQTGENAEGLIVGGAWNYGNPNPSESSVQFVQAFEAANGNSPDQFAAQAYSGAWVLATAIRCADSTDPVAVNDAIGQVKDLETPLGTFSFDADGEPVHQPIAQIVQDGKFVPLASVIEMSATPEAAS